VEKSREDLLLEIKNLKKRKRYGLVWEDKPEKVAELCKEKFPILTEIKTKEIRNNTDSPNILIEGDNYHALSVLNYTHKGKIDVIYIDPPYNRGTGDYFLYDDKIIDLHDSFKHSKWLSFIHKRLKLSKKLLSKNGVIFISIDDYEFSQLKLLCDEIFDEQNFVGNFIWHKKAGGGSDNKNVVAEHEYILCYSRNHECEVLKNLQLDFDDTLGYQGPDENGRFYVTEGILLRGPNSTKEARPNLCYPITCPDGTKLWPRDRKGTWRYSVERFKQEEKCNNIIFKKTKKGWNIYYKIYLYSESGEEKTKKGRTILNSRYRIGQSGEGTVILKNILGAGSFNNPKPVSLIKHLVNLSKKNLIVLDFFAGSGTTGHAILELNEEDDGNRKFILCTNNENNICTEVCYPRLKKVIKGYTNSKNKKIDGLGGNLKYFKTDFINYVGTDANKKKLVDNSTELLCIKEDCFDKVKISEYYGIFKNKDKYIAIIYGDEGIESFKKILQKLKIFTIVYVFSLDDYNKSEEFEDIKDLVRLKPIPIDILNTYRRIFQ